MSNTPAPGAAEAGEPEAGEPRAGERPAAASDGSEPGAGSLSYDDPVTEDRVRLALRKVKDPELNLNVVDLGLVYGIRVDDVEGKTRVAIDMTLTSPACPAGPQIVGDVERTVKGLPRVDDVVVNIVWTPFWSPDLIEPRVRAYMGL